MLQEPQLRTYFKSPNWIQIHPIPSFPCSMVHPLPHHHYFWLPLKGRGEGSFQNCSCWGIQAVAVRFFILVWFPLDDPCQPISRHSKREPTYCHCFHSGLWPSWRGAEVSLELPPSNKWGQQAAAANRRGNVMYCWAWKGRERGGKIFTWLRDLKTLAAVPMAWSACPGGGGRKKAESRCTATSSVPVAPPTSPFIKSWTYPSIIKLMGKKNLTASLREIRCVDFLQYCSRWAWGFCSFVCFGGFSPLNIWINSTWSWTLWFNANMNW